MKIILFIFSTLFVSLGHGVIINCKFKPTAWLWIYKSYTCQSEAENVGRLDFINEVRGTHLSGKSNADVSYFSDHSYALLFIPENLATIFPNLIALDIGGPILQIQAVDIKNFRNLAIFKSYKGRFTSIDGNLFQFNKNIKRVEFYFGKLENVVKNILDGLNQLEYANFGMNTCTQFETFQGNRQSMQFFKQELLVRCPPKNDFRSPNFNSDDMKIKREDKSETASENRELREIILEMRETIEKQNERLLKLEKLLKV